MPTNLHGRALLFSLHLSLGRRSVQDKETTNEVLASKNAEDGAGRFTKCYFPKEALKEITSLDGKWRDETRKLTLPWEGTTRICVAAARERVERLCRDFAQQRETLVSTFLREAYPVLAASAPQRMGALYSPGDFPTLEEMTRSMEHSFSFLPLPDAATMFVENASAADLETIRANAEREIQARFNAGQAEAWRRIMSPVRNFVERLAQPDAIITRPTIDALREIVSLIPSLNLTGDQKLESFRSQVESELLRFDAETLRESTSLRQRMAVRGQELLAQFGQLGQRRLLIETPQNSEPPAIQPQSDLFQQVAA